MTGPGIAPGPARSAVSAILLVCAALAGVPPVAAAPAHIEVRAADTLLVGVRSRARDFQKWVRDASLPDLVWLLRRPSAELGDAEALIARTARDRTPRSRPALRARLEARLRAADPRERSKSGRVPAGRDALARPGASVFRVGALLPDDGDYVEYAASVARGVVAGLGSIPAGGSRRIELSVRGTGDDDPSRLAVALEEASWEEGVLIGELLSGPTTALATGARLTGTPLLSPTATDEAIGTIGPGVFQIGPSGWRRGEWLARAVVDRAGLRVAAIVSSDHERHPLALGFLAAAESLGARVEWRSDYHSGTSFREEVRQLLNRRVEVLMWEGDPRDAEALVRELARQKCSVRLCGGEGLDPARLHADVRSLLEGAIYVSEEWRLPGPERRMLDSLLIVQGAGASTPLHVRGWLAGRAVARAVAEGALCPEELVTALQSRCGPPPWLSTHHFLDPVRDGATLPLYAVRRGQAVERTGPGDAQ